MENHHGNRNDFQRWGFKSTGPRRAVMEFFRKNREGHFTIEEVYDSIHSENPGIGLASVYRTVKLFRELGILRESDFKASPAKFELVLGREEHRQSCHFICENCDRIIDLDLSEESRLMDEISKEIETKYHVRIGRRVLNFYGTCDQCENKE